MAKITASRTITLSQKQGTFTTIFQRFKGNKKQASDLSILRNLLSNEKARLLHTIKTKQPNSIYELAKLLGRDFKSVREDLKILEKFGFLEMIPIHKSGREKLKPMLSLEELQIIIQI